MTQPSKVTGTPVTLSVSAPGSGETFEWYRGASPSTSQPAGTGTQIIVYPTETTQYWVRTKRPTCDADSASVTVYVCFPKINTPPASTGLNEGNSTQLSVSASGPGPLTYQWYYGDSGTTTNPVPGATGMTLVTGPLYSTTKYWVRVSSPVTSGCPATSVNSPTATVTVCQFVRITTQPQPNHLTSTQWVDLTVAATGTITSYQWYEGPAGTMTKPVGTNSSTLRVQPGTTRSYWVRITGACSTASSTAALQSVLPTFTTQPVDDTACSGQNATFTVQATGDPATVTYQWYRQLSGSQTAEPVGSNSKTLTIAATGPQSVWCVATSGTASVSSTCAALSVDPAPLISTSTRKYAGGRYMLEVIPVAEEAPDLEYHWYEGHLGTTTVYYGQGSYYINVYPMTLPSYYWVRVKNSNTGCTTDAEFVTQ